VSRYAFAILLLWPGIALAQSLAITGVTVIDATGAAPRPGMTVLIADGRIATIGKDVAIPEKANVVHGAGKFLIPGLWDMHVHWNDAAYLPLFIANGVTGIRIMWGLPHHLEQRKRIAAGDLLGPRMVIAGPLIDGPRPYWRESVAAATAEQGRQAVQRTRAEGYDFVKVYDSLPRAVFFALADEAGKLKLPLAGHAPAAVGVAAASDAGQRTIEHLTGMLIGVSSVEEVLRREFAAAARLGPAADAAMLRGLGARMLDTYDAGKAAALYAKLKANGTWQVPTFTVLRFVSHAREPQHAADPRLRYMPPRVRSMWSNDPRTRDLLPEDLDHQKRIFQRRLELVGEMHRAGVGILAGSDTLNPWCFAGFSLHDELEWLVKAGLSPMAALQAATRDPAIYLGRAQELGTVEQGKIADLLLLDADPAQDIRNTRRIAAVIAGGKVFSREALDRMLGEIERLANTN
jgi:imidazolonepropionase-like amidohydrolase